MIIKVHINEYGIPNKEPVGLSRSGDDEIEWEGKPGSNWEVRFVRGPNPSKPSPFTRDTFHVPPNDMSGKQVNTAPNQEYKYIIEGTVQVPEEGAKGSATRPLKITVDPTVIIRP